MTSATADHHERDAIERGVLITLREWRAPPGLIARLGAELRRELARDPMPEALFLIHSQTADGRWRPSISSTGVR